METHRKTPTIEPYSLQLYENISMQKFSRTLVLYSQIAFSTPCQVVVIKNLTCEHVILLVVSRSALTDTTFWYCEAKSYLSLCEVLILVRIGVFLVRIFPRADWIRRVSLLIQSECGKIRARKTPNTDTFYAVD